MLKLVLHTLLKKENIVVLCLFKQANGLTSNCFFVWLFNERIFGMFPETIFQIVSDSITSAVSKQNLFILNANHTVCFANFFVHFRSKE